MKNGVDDGKVLDVSSKLKEELPKPGVSYSTKEIFTPWWETVIQKNGELRAKSTHLRQAKILLPSIEPVAFIHIVSKCHEIISRMKSQSLQQKLIY